MYLNLELSEWFMIKEQTTTPHVPALLIQISFCVQNSAVCSVLMYETSSSEHTITHCIRLFIFYSKSLWIHFRHISQHVAKQRVIILFSFLLSFHQFYNIRSTSHSACRNFLCTSGWAFRQRNSLFLWHDIRKNIATTSTCNNRWKCRESFS